MEPLLSCTLLSKSLFKTKSLQEGVSVAQNKAIWRLELRNGSHGIDLLMKSYALEALAAFWRLELGNGSYGIHLRMKSDASGALWALRSEMLPRASI